MDYIQARTNMIEGQLRPNKITNKELLKRIALVKRENFTCNSAHGMAYSDSAVSMKEGRVMLSPMVCARLVQDIDIQAGDRVLVVAGGTGYSAALVVGLTPDVTLVEEDATLTDIAKRALSENDAAGVHVVTAKPEDGYAKGAPFDKIIVDAPMAELPQTLIEQLVDGGKIVGIIEAEDGLLEATVFTKVGHTLLTMPLFETGGDVLTNFKATEKFVF